MVYEGIMFFLLLHKINFRQKHRNLNATNAPQLGTSTILQKAMHQWSNHAHYFQANRVRPGSVVPLPLQAQLCHVRLRIVLFEINFLQ